MTIRELIKELMDYDMDEEVTIGLIRPNTDPNIKAPCTELEARKGEPLIVNRLFGDATTVTIHAMSDEKWGS